MYKYIFMNICKIGKMYLTFFLVTALMICILLSVFALHTNIIGESEKQYGKYAAVVITGNKNYNDGIIIDHTFIESSLNPEYVLDYYAFSQIDCGFEIITYDVSEYSAERSIPYTLMIYSDIAKSTHFRIGDRQMIEGRFAQSTDECNISAELAEKAGLKIGDSMEIWLYRYAPQYYTLKIVGIYENNTEEVTNELTLITPKVSNQSALIEMFGDVAQSFINASEANISRNQILTAAPTTQDLTVFTIYNADLGYSAAVYYTYDEQSVISYTNELENILIEQFVVFDSADTMRAMREILNKTLNSLKALLYIIIITGGLIYIFLVVYILKDRTYDIGVYRSMGMSKNRIVCLLSCEIFIVSIFAFIAGFLLYHLFYTNIADFFYNFQNINEILGNLGVDIMYASRIYDAKNNFIFAPALNTTQILMSLSVTVVIAGIFGIASSLFIARHEPMRTMTER